MNLSNYEQITYLSSQNVKLEAKSKKFMHSLRHEVRITTMSQTRTNLEENVAPERRAENVAGMTFRCNRFDTDALLSQ